MRILTSLILILLAASSYAQENKSDFGFAYSVLTGPMLPNQIKDVTEIQPTWGVLFDLPMSDGGMYEAGWLNSNAHGVKYNNFFLSIRGEMPVDSMIIHAYIGGDIQKYVTDTGTEHLTGGGHVGTGLLVPISGKLYFRSDMKFNVNPGTSLFVGFGFEVRMGSKSSSSNQ